MPGRRIAGAWIVAAVALLGGSCGKSHTEYAATIDPSQLGRTTDLKAFRAYLDTFSHGDLHHASRLAICGDSAPSTRCVDSVTIQAIGLSRDIRADSGPARGRVIGVIRNLDASHVTLMDSLKPASQAEYYIYIDRSPSAHARWNLLEVPTDSSGVIRRIVQNEVHQCGEKPGYKWTRSDVKFANCGDNALTGMTKADLFSSSNWKKFGRGLLERLKVGDAAMLTEQGKWFGCPWGCCT